MNTLFKHNAFRKMSTTLRFAPWVLLICVFTLASFLLFFDFSASKRETSAAIYLTKEKGASLIHSFEATLFSSATWTDEKIEKILAEQANRTDIYFFAIVNKKGVIMVASDKGLIGQKILETHAKTTSSPFVDGNVKELEILIRGTIEKKKVYLVDKQLFVDRTSINRGNQRNRMMRRHGKMSHTNNMKKRSFRHIHDNSTSKNNSDKLLGSIESNNKCTDNSCNMIERLSTEKQIYMVVGFDMQDIITAQMADDERSKILKIVFAFLLTLGVFSFFILRAYQRSYTMTQEGKAYILSLMDALPLGIITLDHENKILTMNPNSESLTKHKESKSIGKNIAEIIPKLHDENFESNLKNITITLYHADQNPISVEVNTFPIFTDGESHGHGVILRDLRELQKLQEELHRQERLASIGKLAAGIAHEIRNPLGSIKGIARLFEESSEKESEDAKLAAIMTQEVMRVDKVVSDLLELSKPNVTSIEKTNLKHLIEKTKNSVLLQNDTTVSSVSFTQNLCSQCEEVFLDEDRMIQVLQNLFLNSIQAMPQGGVIHVEAHYIQEKNIQNHEKDDELQTHEDKDKKRYHGSLLEIIISDNGKGIAQENIKNLFTPYYTDRANGTGLGLAMVQKIIQAHNGYINIESEENVGTKITIRIPQ